MEKLHFHCQNCTRNEELFNITCIEEIKEHIDSNLYTIISYNTCDNCKELLKELDIVNYDICHHNILIEFFNLKLIEQYGFFCDTYLRNKNILYHSYDTTRIKWVEIDKKNMFDSIKDGSLIEIYSLSNISNLSDYDYDLEEMIKYKGYKVSLIKTANNFHYYIVKKPTLTKAAIK